MEEGIDIGEKLKMSFKNDYSILLIPVDRWLPHSARGHEQIAQWVS